MLCFFFLFVSVKISFQVGAVAQVITYIKHWAHPFCWVVTAGLEEAMEGLVLKISCWLPRINLGVRCGNILHLSHNSEWFPWSKEGQNSIQMSELCCTLYATDVAMVCLCLLTAVGLKSSFVLKNSFCWNGHSKSFQSQWKVLWKRCKLNSKAKHFQGLFTFGKSLKSFLDIFIFSLDLFSFYFMLLNYSLLL